MFRRKEDINTFNFKEIIQHLKIFIFSQKYLICAEEALLQGKPDFLTMKMMKI